MSLVDKTIQFVRSEIAKYDHSHDWNHTKRVWRMACYIGEIEQADLKIIELAALLHDVGDHKFHDGDLNVSKQKVELFLNALGISSKEKEHIINIVENVSFGKEWNSDFNSLELDCVQDADRLDAIGAIGIARTFHYGGHKGYSIYDPSIKPHLDQSKQEYRKSDAPTINHFYEKLLLLKDRMNTNTGKKLAVERHEFMEQFLQQFYQEWNFNTTLENS